MKEPIGLVGQTYITSHKIRKLAMQTEEPVSSREYTDRLVKIIDSAYVKAYLEQVAANSTQLNAKVITQLLRLLKEVEDFFDGTIGDWNIETSNL